MYAVTYYGTSGKLISASASTYSRAQEKAAKVAIHKDRPFPITIQDDLGRVIETIKG